MKSKTSILFQKAKLLPLVVLLCSVLYSCSNDNVTEIQPEKTTDLKDVSIKTGTSIKSSVKFQFNEFLSKNELTRSTNDQQWDFDNMVEFSSTNNSVYCYMVPDKNNPDKILGGCSTTKDVITTFFTFQKNGDIYTLVDSFNQPVADVKLDLEKQEILLVNIYNSNTKASGSEWCGIGMAVAGGVGAAFAPITLGASIGFAACWGVVSALMCR